MDDDAILDLDIITKEDRAKDLRARRDIYTLANPDAAANILARHRNPDDTLQDIRVRAHILGKVPNIAPVALSDVAKDRVALLEHHRKEFLAEVERLVLLKVAEDLGIENVDTCVDRIAEDLAPA